MECPRGPLWGDAGSGLGGAGSQHRPWGPGAWGSTPEGGGTGKGEGRGGEAAAVRVLSLSGSALGGGTRSRALPEERDGSSQGRGKFRSGAGGHGKTRPVTAHSCFWLTAPMPLPSCLTVHVSALLSCASPSHTLCLSLTTRPPGPTTPLSHSPHSPMAPRSGVPCCQLLWNIPLLSLPYYFSCLSWAFPALGALQSLSGTLHINSRALGPHTIEGGQRELGCGPAPERTGQLPPAAQLPLTSPQPRDLVGPSSRSGWS